MFDWTMGPPEPNYQALKWEQEVEEEYDAYIRRTCFCADLDDCKCLSLEEFRDKKCKQVEDWLDFREEQNDYYRRVE